MKTRLIDPLARKDIQHQVAKILRGLGNPSPPLELKDVRELLKLDCQFYSSGEDGALREIASKIKIGARQVAKRPTILWDVIKKAELKALWLPDRQRILIDANIAELKKRHTEAHEIAHSIIPHHKLFLFGDDGVTLQPACHEILEAEANYGSGELLFLGNLFREQAHDLPASMESIKRLAKAYGNTITMTLWRFVENGYHGRPLFGVVSSHPHRLCVPNGQKHEVRYLVASPEFRNKFSEVEEATIFIAIQGYAAAKSGGSLGKGITTLIANDGSQHRFCMETFYNRYEALTLGTHIGPVPTIVHMG